jgi:Domain of unknown function (DUF3854)
MTTTTEPSTAETSILSPVHLKMIQESGIKPDIAEARGYKTVIQQHELRRIGFREAQCLVPALLIPVWGVAGQVVNYQSRPDTPRMNRDGDIIKYETPGKSRMRLDIHPHVRQRLGDPAVPLFITEGVRKSGAGVSIGLCCIALLGVWNWRGKNEQDGKVALPEWESVALNGRQVYVCFDSDVMVKPEVHAALSRFKPFLEHRGAKVAIIYLPPGEAGEKVGLDDFLAAGHTASDLMALASPTLRGIDGAPAHDDLEDLLGAADAKLLHPAQDFIRLPDGRGALTYGLPVGDGAIILLNSSSRKWMRVTPETDPDILGGHRLRHANPGPSTVSKAAALAWITAGAKGSIASALDRLEPFFTKYVVLRDPNAALVLAAWSLGTWCYRGFRLFPYVNLTSSERRCGKTRVLGLLGKVCFNGSVETFPTEAALYRAPAESGGTQLYDEVENLQGHDGRFDALVSVLNAGFERGATVPRVEKRGDEFITCRYEVYCPRALTGIKGLRDTLEDRSVQLFMDRRRRNQAIHRITAETNDEAQAIRDLCAVACLDGIDQIDGAYGKAPDIMVTRFPDLDDRAVDLWAPLFAIVMAADAEDGGGRRARLFDALRGAAQLRDADADDGPTIKLVSTLEEIADKQDLKMTPAELVIAIQAKGFPWVKSTKALASLMNRIDFFRSRDSKNADGKQPWHYVIEQDRLKDLRERYGAPEAP